MGGDSFSTEIAAENERTGKTAATINAIPGTTQTETNSSTEVFTRRFYILAVFSIFTMEQCANWNTWGPVAASAKQVFCLTDADIASLASIGLYGFVAAIAPATYLLHHSLRLSVLFGSLVIWLGAMLRCLPLVLPSLPLKAFPYLAYIAACLISLAGPVAMAGCLSVSSNWFPPSERNFATSVGQMFNALGLGFSFVLSFLILPEDEGDNGSEEGIGESRNGTDCSNSSLTLDHLTPVDSFNSLMTLQYVHAGITTILLFLVVLYFPSKPAKPPSNSAAEERTQFREGFSQLVRARDAWLILVAYAFPQCLIQLWQSMMVVNLTQLDGLPVSERWVTLLGTVLCFTSVAASIAVASLLSRPALRRRMRLSILVLLLLASAFFVVTTMIVEGVISVPDLSNFKLCLYLLLLPGTSLALASSPITFELSVETCFPVSEGVIGGWMTGWFNCLGAVFFLIFFIPDIGTRWLNFVLPLSVILPLPAVLLVRENYRRMAVDDQQREA